MSLSRYDQVFFLGGMSGTTIYCGIDTHRWEFILLGILLTIASGALCGRWEREEGMSWGGVVPKSEEPRDCIVLLNGDVIAGGTREK